MNIILRKIKMYLRDIYYLIHKVKRILFENSYEVYSFYIHPTVKIGNNVIIRKHCNIGKNIVIGKYTFINDYTRIDTSIKSIGKYCSISHNVKIGMVPHPLDLISTSPVFYSLNRGVVKEEIITYSKKSIIGNDVFIGSNSVILYGVNIGDGAVVAAGSVVTKDIPPYAIVGGVPAKIIRYRFSILEIQKLLKYKWWNKDHDFLISNSKDMLDSKFIFINTEI